jgi:hypothetical protein
VHGLQTGAVIAVSLIAMIVTLAASEVLVRGVGRLARNLALLGGVGCSVEQPSHRARCGSGARPLWSMEALRSW